MPGEFEGHDISGMVDSISQGLGFGDDTPSDADPLDSAIDNDPALQDPPIEAPAPAPAAATPPAAPAPNPTSVPNLGPAPSPRDPNAPPNSWTADAKAAWASLPENIRAEVHRREENFFQGLEQYRQGAEVGKQFNTVMAEYMPTLQQYGIDPFQQVAGLMKAHHTLALGAPEQKVELFRQLARDYQVDLGQLAPQDPNNAPFVDPAVEDLRKQVSALQSSLNEQQRLAMTAQRQEITRKVEEFAKSHEDFDLLQNEISALVKSGQDLETAYNNARWMNPTTRAKMVDQQTKDALAASAKAAKEAAEKAAKAQRPRIPAKSVSPTVAAGSLEETMMNTLKEIRARQD